METTHSIYFFDKLIEVRMKTSIPISNHQRRPFCPIPDATHHRIICILKLFHRECCSHFTCKGMIFMVLFFPCFKWRTPEISMEYNSEAMSMHEYIPPAETIPTFLFFYLFFIFFFWRLQLETTIVVHVCPEIR